MSPTPRFRVPGPGVTPLPFGLLSVATVVASDGEPTVEAPQLWRNGIEFESDAPLGPVSATVDACVAVDDEDRDDPAPAGATKSGVHGVPYRDFAAFTLYAVHECSTGGRNRDADVARAGRLLTNGEAFALERVVESGGMSQGLETALDHSFAADASVFTLGGPLPSSVAASFAIAEQNAALVWGGMGYVIHASRSFAAMAHAEGYTLTRNGARLETVLGTPVVAGAGYQGGPPDAEAAEDVPATYGWLYVTGPVVVHRGPVDLPDKVSIIRRDVNTTWAVAERTYSVGWEFGTFAVPVPRVPDLLTFPDP